MKRLKNQIKNVANFISVLIYKKVPIRIETKNNTRNIKPNLKIVIQDLQTS